MKSECVNSQLVSVVPERCVIGMVLGVMRVAGVAVMTGSQKVVDFLGHLFDGGTGSARGERYLMEHIHNIC